MNVERYWQAVLRKDAAAIRESFHPQARIYWHNSDECFTVEDFIRANCQYPGDWAGRVKRIERLDGLVVTVTQVWAQGGDPSLHAVSFFELSQGKILRLDEYWGDDGPAPQWRRALALGQRIPSE